MATNKYEKLPLGRIKPEGWLKRQLQLQADGLTGHLDEIWADVSSKSAWLGGNGEAWERGPYYLDGLISLAYLLDDEVLINKANVWIEKILLSVDVNGFFGPKRTNDWWPRTIAIKALTSYAEATGDRQILPFVRNYFKYQFNEIDNQPMYAWASARALEELLPLKYLYDNTGDEMVLELIKKLKEGSYDWFGVYENFKFKRYAKYYLSKNIINIAKRFGAKNDEKKKSGTAPLKPMTKQKILKRNKRRTVKKLMLTHGVNNAMAVKYPVLYSEFFPSDELEILSKKAVQTLLKYHGTAVGVFTSDEQLNGASPVQGIELCTVVEFMRSLESLMQITGDMYYADLLELVAFNALPASINKNFTAHQYVQQVNQISATRDKRDFFDVGSDGTIFGLSPNYGCCTANMHQGFPKFTEHLCMRHGSELAFLIYAPCSIDTEVDGVKIKLTETTDYPFKNDVKITVDAVSGNPDITFTFRIPQYASAILSINGAEYSKGTKGVLTVKKQIIKGDVIHIKFETPLTILNNSDKSISIRRGSLLMATRLKSKQKIIHGREPFCDSEYISMTQWRTTPEIVKKELVVTKQTENEVPPIPFDEDCPPIEIEYKARYVLNWDVYKNSADEVPKKPILAEESFLRTLVPYGCTRIRIAQHPHFTRSK